MATSRTLREAALNDPLRSSGGVHEAGRFQRGIAEFLRLPLLITAGFCILGASLLTVTSITAPGVRAGAHAAPPADAAAPQ